VTVTVRTAVEADLPALLALYGELHPADPPLAAATATTIWRAMAEQPGRTVFVAVDEDTVMGTVDCSVLANLTRGGAPFLLVENVVVAASARRRGIGALLMTAARALAGETGCYKIQLLSRADRQESHRFYESCGYRALAAGYRLYLNE
jgi:GNAT superfamily N-acetyltransferase